LGLLHWNKKNISQKNQPKDEDNEHFLD
jgi:hypothetical protein